MLDWVDWLREFILNYPTLKYLIIFIGAGLGGEISTAAFAFLAAQNFISLNALIIFSFLGTIFSDSIWFLAGKLKMVEKVIMHKHVNPTVILIAEAIRKVSNGNHFLALTLAKFLIGTRIVFFIYANKTDLSFREFSSYNAVAILIWMLVIIPIGFMAGLGFTYLSEIFQNFYAGIGFVLLVVVIIVMLQLWLKKYFTRVPPTNSL